MLKNVGRKASKEETMRKT